MEEVGLFQHVDVVVEAGHRDTQGVGHVLDRLRVAGDVEDALPQGVVDDPEAFQVIDQDLVVRDGHRSLLATAAQTVQID